MSPLPAIIAVVCAITVAACMILFGVAIASVRDDPDEAPNGPDI